MVPDGVGGQTLDLVVPIVKSTVNVTAHPQARMSTVLGTVTGCRQKNGFVPTKNATVSRRSNSLTGGKCKRYLYWRQIGFSLDHSTM